MAEVVGRFAPTPSGRMHLGNVLSCLMSWLGARSVGGKMVMRVEDLDPRAANREVAALLMEDLLWLGLDWDEGPVYQSDRSEVYAEAVEQLEAQGLTYPCFCTRSELHAASAPHASDGTYVYQGTCRNLTAEQVHERLLVRPPATRLRVPDKDDPAGTISFADLVVGDRSEVLATGCGDFLIRRSDGVFGYQLAVVVDDGAMGVTQVVRGRDLLGSCARQRYLQRHLGLPEVAYAHVPLLVAPDGRRLSKRDRDLDLGVLRERGVRAERVVGVIAWACGLVDEPVEVRPEDVVHNFSWGKVAAAGERIVVDNALLSLLG